MSRQYKNKKHLDWVHGLKCSLAGNRDCLGPLQAHHLLKPWEGFRGMGMKASDRNVIPLCLRHHIMLHKRGNELAFFQEMTGDEEYGQKEARYLWHKSPHNGIGRKGRRPADDK